MFFFQTLQNKLDLESWQDYEFIEEKNEDWAQCHFQNPSQESSNLLFILEF